MEMSSSSNPYLPPLLVPVNTNGLPEEVDKDIELSDIPELKTIDPVDFPPLL